MEDCKKGTVRDQKMWADTCDICRGSRVIGNQGRKLDAMGSEIPPHLYCPDCADGRKYIYRTPAQYAEATGEEWVGAVWMLSDDEHFELFASEYEALIVFAQKLNGRKIDMLLHILCAATPAPPENMDLEEFLYG